jgi:hypothetical protein
MPPLAQQRLLLEGQGVHDLIERVAGESNDLRETEAEQPHQPHQQRRSRPDQPTFELGVGRLGDAEMVCDIVLRECGAVARVAQAGAERPPW